MSSFVCVVVGISLSKIRPFGITGYTTIEQNILNYIDLKTADDFKKFVYEKQ